MSLVIIFFAFVTIDQVFFPCNGMYVDGETSCVAERTADKYGNWIIPEELK